MDELPKECHHIIPKCMGGLNDSSNLVDLTLEEHFIAHQLLALENPDNYKLQHAFRLMSHIRRVGDVTEIKTPEQYRIARLDSREYIGKLHIGQALREETKRKISEANKGKKRTQEMNERNRQRNIEYYKTHKGVWTGKKMSEEARQHMSEAHKRRDPSTYKGGAKTPEGKALAVAKFKETYWAKPEEVRKEQIRKSLEKRTPARYWTGKTIPHEMREKISETLKEKHLCPPHAMKVYCQETDTVYRSMTEAEQMIGVDRHIIKRYINGLRKDDKYHFSLVEK